MTDNDFEVCETGTHEAICEMGLELCHLRNALREIINMESCLLADAKVIAEEALQWAKANELSYSQSSSSSD